jgi:hypothetical protein
MMGKQFFELSASEGRIAQMAATIYAGHAAGLGGALKGPLEQQYIDLSVAVALKLARAVDDAVQDAEEGTKDNLDGGFFQE